MRRSLVEIGGVITFDLLVLATEKPNRADTSIKVLDTDGLIRTKTDHREKGLPDRWVLARIREQLQSGES